MNIVDIEPALIARRARPTARWAVFAAWLAAAAGLAAVHVIWRDEMRALSLATSGTSTLAMLRTIHGEGHPALWYLILRAAHAIVPVPQVLPAAAFAIGAGGALLFALRAPFRWPMLALVLFGRFALYEYTVMARNYGLSMLLMFAFAATYRRYRTSGWVPGLLLLLLSNTNVHSAVLAAALLLFWMIDLAGEEPIGRTKAWHGFLIGAGLAALGALACFATVYPPINDAALSQGPSGPAIIGPFKFGSRFKNLMPDALMDWRRVVVPLLLVGCLLRLAGRPAAIVAAVAGILGVSVLFTFVYAGAYRHVALLLPFLLTLAWLTASGRGGRWPARLRKRLALLRPAERIGTAALVGLLLLQAMQSLPFVSRALRGMPESRSQALAQLLQRPDLRGAIVMIDPDYMAEALPYYTDNPLYLVREQRFGRWAAFSRKAARTVSLGLITDTAQRLARETKRAVVIALGDPVARSGRPGRASRYGYGDYRQTAAELRRFHAIARPIADFARVEGGGDESYAVYAVMPPLRAAPGR